MNERGNLILVIFAMLIGAVIILPILMAVFPPLDIIVRIFLVFSIFMTVRGFLGNGVLTLIVTGILIYFLVIKWWWIGAGGWMAITLASLGIFGVIVWGSQTMMMFVKK